MGGGFGIHYRKQEAKPASAFAEVILPAVKETGCQLVLEPGRFIVGNAGDPRQPRGVHQGHRRQALRHPGRGDERPHPPDAVRLVPPHLAGEPAADVPAPPDDYDRTTRTRSARCRTASTRTWSARCARAATSWRRTGRCPTLKRGDLLAMFCAGAYGMAMASNYNARPRAAEVLVTGRTHRLIRRRETFDDLVACEEDCLT